MARKRYTAEEIIGPLRTIEIENGQRPRDRGGLSQVEYHRTELRDELLNGELFYTLQEARVIVEGWRQRYNTHRPHSALGYRPPSYLEQSLNSRKMVLRDRIELSTPAFSGRAHSVHACSYDTQSPLFIQLSAVDPQLGMC